MSPSRALSFIFVSRVLHGLLWNNKQLMKGCVMSIFKKKHIITVNCSDLADVFMWAAKIGAPVKEYTLNGKNEVRMHVETTKKQWKKLVEINAMNAKLKNRFMFVEIEA